MNVLSLFDGMSCGQLALNNIGIKPTKYYASEIDHFAIKVCQENFPFTIQVGDVVDLKREDIPDDIDLLIGGSPSQGFSMAGKQLNFDDPRSALFFEFVRILKEFKPKYFLLENVRMKKEYEDVITEYMQVEPIQINASRVSAQNRVRLYWTNIPGVDQPSDKGIVLRDILEDLPKFKREKMNSRNGKGAKALDDKAVTMTASMFKGAGNDGVTLVPQPKGKEGVDGLTKEQLIEYTYQTNGKPKQVGIAVDINGHDILKRVYDVNGKAPTLNTCGGGNREPKVMVTGASLRGRAYDENGKRLDRNGASIAGIAKQYLELREDAKGNCLTTINDKDNLVAESTDNMHFFWRKLSPVECERLQGVPDNYTACVSNSQRYKQLGNGWCVPVIEHIFKNMKDLPQPKKLGVPKQLSLYM